MSEIKSKKQLKWETSFPNKIVQTNDVVAIKKYIEKKIKYSKRSIKPFNFYKFLAVLHEKHPLLVEDLVPTLPELGCWKEFNVLLLACKNVNNLDLEEFVYDILAKQLKQDKENFNNKKPISNLAKWIPRQQKSFDKKLNFVTKICKVLYKEEIEKNEKKVSEEKVSEEKVSEEKVSEEKVEEKFPIDGKTYRHWYRKLVATLNKHLDTTEIKLCAREYDQIDFTNMPATCLKKHTPTFMKHDITKQNLEKLLFKEYLTLDTKSFFDKIIFKDQEKKENKEKRKKNKETEDAEKAFLELEKDILSQVYNINKHNFFEYIKNITGVSLKNCDLVLDLSKSIYDHKLVSMSVAAAVLSKSFDVNKNKNTIIINSHNPSILEFDDEYKLFDNIDTVMQECIDCPVINLQKIVDNKLSNKKNILVITDKPGIDPSTIDGKKVTIWQLDPTSFKKETKRNIIIKNNLNKIRTFLNSREELKKSNIWILLVLVSVLVIIFYFI